MEREKNLKKLQKKQKAKKMKPSKLMKQETVVPISEAEAMVEMDREMGRGLRETLEKAGICTKLVTSELAITYHTLLEFAETLGRCAALVKEELKLRAMRKGQLQPTGGFNLQTEDGWVIVLTPHTPPGTLDDKKVEAMLRAKGYVPADFMDTKVTFKANKEKLERAVTGGDGEEAFLFTPEDIKSCEKPPVWSLQKLRRVEDRGDAERVSVDEGGEP